MSNSLIKVSTKELNFVKNEPATLILDITKGNDNRNEVGLKVTQNLPLCFNASFSTAEHQPPCSLKVVYDPGLADKCNLNSLWIKLSTNNGEVTIVNVRIAGEEKPFEALQCQICNHQYCEEDENLIPRMLTGCGHTLCNSCLNEMKKCAVSKGNILCPFDRKQTPVRQQLPKNFAIIEMLREKKALEESKKTEEVPVTSSEIIEDPEIPCYENPNHEATIYCSSCKVDFCQSCFDKVHSLKIMSAHQSVPIAEKPIIHPNCIFHMDRLIDFKCIEEYCEALTKFCCLDCLQNEHKDHKHESIESHFEHNLNQLGNEIEMLNESIRRSEIRLETIQSSWKTFDKLNPEYIKKMESITVDSEEEKEWARMNLDTILESEKDRLETEEEEMKHVIKLMIETKREMEKRLKRNEDILDVRDICDDAKALCSLENGSGEYIGPLNPNFLSDGMPIIYVPPAPATIKTPPLSPAGPSRKRENPEKELNDVEAKIVKTKED